MSEISGELLHLYTKRRCTYSIGRDLGSSWLNISDFSKGLCGLPLPTVLNRNVTLWVVYHFCFFSTYRNGDSHSNATHLLLCSYGVISFRLMAWRLHQLSL